MIIPAGLDVSVSSGRRISYPRSNARYRPNRTNVLRVHRGLRINDAESRSWVRDPA